MPALARMSAFHPLRTPAARTAVRSLRVRVLVVLSPLGTDRHRVGIAAATSGTYEPLAPLWNSSLSPVPLRHLAGFGLDPVAACLVITR